MKVRFTRPVADWQPGTVVDLDDRRARGWVATGYAVYVTEPGEPEAAMRASSERAVAAMQRVARKGRG